MDNATRKFLLQRHKQSGFPGSILDVFQAYNQGIDIIGQFEQQNNMQVAQTPQQQQQGLRPAHQAGNISQSMIFPNVPPNTPFNTVGMKAPINIEKYDEQGHLVKSYENVPPGVQNLPTGPQRGTVIETPANMQSGGELTFKQRVGNIKRDLNSELLDGASWRAQSDARDAARDGIQGEGDSYRHILGSAYSVNALRKKGFGPITSMIAANALGVGHELTADSNNTFRESLEDLTNNFAGSVLGLFNNDEQAKETAKKMVPYLPDGLPQEYGDRRYEGFQGQYQAGGIKFQDTMDFIDREYGPDQFGDTLTLNAMDLISEHRQGILDAPSVRDTIAYHETGSHQRMQPNAVQIVKDKDSTSTTFGQLVPGVGRGKYMYDKPSTLTAANRVDSLSSYMGLETPGFIRDLQRSEGTSRADTLTGTQQDMLYMGDLIEGPAPGKAYGSGKATLEDVWYRGHNRREDEEGARLEFRESMRGIAQDNLRDYYFAPPKPNFFERQKQRRGGPTRKYFRLRK